MIASFIPNNPCMRGKLRWLVRTGLVACVLALPATSSGAAAPFAAPQAASPITISNATLNGMATPNGFAATA